MTPPATQFQERSPLSVSELNLQVKHLLELSFASVWVEGEISNFAAPSSGHWYFTLKDENAQIKCAMFRGRNLHVRPRPGNGDRIMVSGKVSLYPGRGDYQLIVDTIEAAGTGNLHRAFEQLKAKLQAEGLFDTGRKRALPAFPKHVGIITSPTGAAIHDIITVFRKRCPMIRLSVFPSLVQGAEAAASLCSRLQEANRDERLDALIVGRGGGSLEDLWPFNEESVARAIAASRLPVISAVGHESDFTIADFVADYRAPTPSAAAERLSPDALELAQRIDVLEARLLRSQQAKLQQLSAKTEQLRVRLKSPQQHLAERTRYLDALRGRLMITINKHLNHHQLKLARADDSLQRTAPRQLIEKHRQRITMLDHQLDKLITQKVHHCEDRFSRLASKLDAISPLATLSRGYAAITDDDGAIIQSVHHVKPASRMAIYLKDGAVDATVTDVYPGKTILQK